MKRPFQVHILRGPALALAVFRVRPVLEIYGRQRIHHRRRRHHLPGLRQGEAHGLLIVDLIRESLKGTPVSPASLLGRKSFLPVFFWGEEGERKKRDGTRVQ